MAQQAKAEPVDRLVCGECGVTVGTVHHQSSSLLGVPSVEWYERLSQDTLSAMTHHTKATAHLTYVRQEAIILSIEDVPEEDEAQ